MILNHNYLKRNQMLCQAKSNGFLLTTHLIYCVHSIKGDCDYMDDQTSRKEMREKISLDTRTVVAIG